MNYSIQLYSVRDGKSLDDILKGVAEIGYKEVEFAGYKGHTAAEVRTMLDKYGLAVSGIHDTINPLLENFDNTIEFSKKIGNKHFIICSHDVSSQEKIDELVANINMLVPKLREHGITLGYHNHERELTVNEDGSLPFDQLIYRTDIEFEVDTYWAYVAMKNPIAVLERVKDRLTFIHLKDGKGDANRSSGEPLGLGDAPVNDCYYWAIANGKRIVVESETLKPSGMAEAKICFDYIKIIEKQEDAL